MYPNLEAEIARNGIINGDMHKVLGISPRALYDKRHGKTEFTLKEMRTLQNYFFPNNTLDYLFAKGA